MDEADVDSFFITFFVTFLNLITGLFESVKFQQKLCYHCIPILRYKKASDDNFSRKRLPWLEWCPSRQLAWFSESLRTSLTSLQIFLPRPKLGIVSNWANNRLFAHCYKNIREHSNSQLRLSFGFEHKNNTCVISIKKFGIHRNQLIAAEIFNINHYEVFSLYKNRCYWLQVWIFWKQLWHLTITHQETHLVTRTVSTKTAMEKIASFLTFMQLLRDTSMFTERVERDRFFTKYPLAYSDPWGRQKQTKHAFSLPKKTTCYLASKGLLMFQFNHLNTARNGRAICMWTTTP